MSRDRHRQGHRENMWNPNSTSDLPQRPMALGAQVAQSMRVLIISGQLPPGAHLVEDALAVQFDVSRGPVRDALRELQHEGLIEPKRRGYYVLGLAAQDIDELYSLRGALEAFAVSLAMTTARPEDWEPAHLAVQEMKLAAEADDAMRFSEMDMTFHSFIYQLSRHSRLAAVWRVYGRTFAAILQVTNGPGGDLRESAEDHAALLKILREGDETKAVNAVKAHLYRASRRLQAVRWTETTVKASDGATTAT